MPEISCILFALSFFLTLFFIQLIKIAFDEEVGSENVATLRNLLNKFRSPVSVFSTFAFTGHAIQQVTNMHKEKEKNASLR